MGRKKEIKKGNIELNTTLSIFNASELHEKMREAYKYFDSIEIDLKDITDCDTAGIQLLFSLKKSCRDTGKELTLLNPSEPVIDALSRMSVSWDMLNS